VPSHDSQHAQANSDSASTALHHLAERIQHAAHLLPAQGPIDVFIHHNTLHAFEHQTFDDAVGAGARVFGCEPYLSEDRYREELERGRILTAELRSVLARDLGARSADVVHGSSTRFDVRMAMLEHPLRSGARSELAWFIAETDALLKVSGDVPAAQRRRWITETRHWAMRWLLGSAPDRPVWSDELLTRFNPARVERWSDEEWEAFTLSALWEACREGARLTDAGPPPVAAFLRHRDLLVALGGIDSDQLVHGVLIPFCAAFLDQGIAHWGLPERERGLFHSFCSMHRRVPIGSAWWRAGLCEQAARLQDQQVGALACIQQSLDALGVQPTEMDQFLSATLLTLRGWAGMIWHVEERPDRVQRAVPPDSLIELLAVRLLLDRFAVTAAARASLDYRGDLRDLRPALAQRLPSAPTDSVKQRAFLLFQLAQVLGWTPQHLALLRAEQWRALFDEVESFTEVDRRRVFHLAYEHRFRVQALDALSSRSHNASTSAGARPLFQAVFCIDEREESIRRHVEEIAPTSQTFGAAGFFGVVMYYRGVAAAHFVPLCPVVVRPAHWVSETIEGGLLAEEQRRRGTRRRLGMALASFHGGSRRIVSGALLSATIGLLATVPLVASVVFPRLTARIRGYFGRFIAPPPITQLTLERGDQVASPDPAGHGFAVAEMINIAERLLRDISLTSNFARVVLMVGHGSSSMNNPHESAHDCGACGGGVGGPNARAVAQMLNDPRVRAGLMARGVEVPDDTVFVGGLHNTADDNVTFADVDRVPTTHHADFELARSAMHEASLRNAHERARRFHSAPLRLAAQAAKWHVEGRSEDLSQVRPEWGHATNALCVVGRRQITRGLFLDRRSFLVSYDPTADTADAAILARILAAVVPVCAGINLEYYFSYVDSPGWGSGSKLPHNITGLLGVMDGAMSDLRTGLPWQMVEIHEPVRLLFVIETSAAAFLAIMEQNPAIKTMVANLWVQVAVVDPSDGSISLYQQGRFEPYVPDSAVLPIAQSSGGWYAGHRDHLPFAEIRSTP